MMCFTIPKVYRRHLPDILAGFAVFACVVGLMVWHLGVALAAGPSLMSTLDGNATVLLLAGAFAAMTIFNVAFLRHLRRAYAPPRRAAAHRDLSAGGTRRVR